MTTSQTTRAAFDFDLLIAPIEPAHFFAESWEKRPLVISRQSPDYYSDLCSLADVEWILSSTDLRYPAIRLVRHGPDLPTDAYTRDLRSRRFVFAGVGDTDRILLEYQRGATILLQRVERSWPPLTALCGNLEQVFYHPVDANAYLTPASSQGFGVHYDTHDVFILQLAGSKHWRLYDAPLRLPLESQPFDQLDVNPGPLSQQIDLHAGDLIYLPRGTFHEALTSTCSSLHVTVAITPHRWADLIADAVAVVARQDERFRESVPLGSIRGQDAVSLEGRFEELLRILSERVNLAEVLDGLTDRFITERRLPLDGQLAQLEELGRLGARTVVARRPGLLYRLALQQDKITLVFSGKKITYPSGMEAALRYIATAAELEVDSIPNLDAVQRLLLVHRLIREGFVIVVRQPPQDEGW
jgi:ribosomal protein L16 Arg81 hydroxylase